jgi:hypothetical protein
MSSSDLAKQGLRDYFAQFAKIESKVSDWKRTAKIKTGSHGEYLRRFENVDAGIVAFVHDESLEEYEGEGDRLSCHEGGDLFVAIHEEADPDAERFTLMFVSQTQWEREGYFPDQHWGHILKLGYGIPEELIGDECMENTFVPAKEYQDGTKEELIAALTAISGVTYNPTLDSAVDNS